jgi:hypothetical protein
MEITSTSDVPTNGDETRQAVAKCWKMNIPLDGSEPCSRVNECEIEDVCLAHRHGELSKLTPAERADIWRIAVKRYQEEWSKTKQ